MPGYPIESDKLLHAADLLAPVQPGRGRPPFTAHRRAVSTAYYAVFHAITERVASTTFSTADPPFRQSVRRWIGHGDIRTVARWVGQLQGTTPGGAPPHIRSLLAPTGGVDHVDADTAAMCEGFLELNDKRELADYDHRAVFTRPDTRGHIALAREVVTTVERTQSPGAMLFFGLVSMQAKIQAR